MPSQNATTNILSIVKEPAPVLRKKAREVGLDQICLPRIQKLIAAMKETLARTPDGVGLAAPQIGESLRMFIISDEAEEIDRAEERSPQAHDQNNTNELAYEKRPWHYYVFINPVVKRMSKRKLKAPEGCLSVPGLFGSVDRLEKVTVEAYDEHGKKITRGGSRFFARVMQHELDHLDGALFIDKAERLVRNARAVEQ